MTTRLGNFLALLLILGFALLYLQQTLIIPVQPSPGTVGPTYLPLGLAGLLIILVAIAAFREWQKENEHVEIANKTEIALTVVLSGVYFFLWSRLGYFYPLTAFFFFALVLAYTRRTLSARSVAFAAFYAVLFSAFLYVTFELALKVNFA